MKALLVCVGVCCVLLAGCGSGDTSSGSDQDGVESTETSESTTPEPSSDYSSATLTYVDDDGWSYLVEPLQLGVTANFGKTIANSPPGMARFTTEIIPKPGFGVDITGNTPGRTAPTRRPYVDVYFPVTDNGSYGNSETFLDSQLRTDGFPECNVGSAPGYYTADGGSNKVYPPELPSKLGLECQFGVETGWITEAGATEDEEETTVDDLLAELKGVKPVIVVTADLGEACFALYFPNGSVSVSQSKYCDLRVNSSETTTTAGSASSTTVAGETGDEAAVLPDPPAGATLTEPTTCPPAGGSAKRVQVFAGPPPDCLQAGAKYTATFDTTEGSFTAKLDSAAAPKAVNNFVVLSRYHYYDGVPFHRTVARFVIQAGDGDGAPWGNNDLGYEFEDELPESSAAYTDYSLVMANAGPNTNGSQFFVVLPDGGQQLQPLFTFFGQVTEGTEVVDTIGALSTPSQEPSKAVIINSVTINET
jgi:peptidyl-prolyl cis-trans isomerase B (cyclophilin B)